MLVFRRYSNMRNEYEAQLEDARQSQTKQANLVEKLKVKMFNSSSIR